MAVPQERGLYSVIHNLTLNLCSTATCIDTFNVARNIFVMVSMVNDNDLILFVVECSAPSVPSNTKLNSCTKNNAVTSECTFSCLSGFEYADPVNKKDTVICQTDGTWNPVADGCIGMIS